MPIELESPINRITEKEFHELDFRIMRIAFDIHNDLGRFYDEKIYQAELERRCSKAGIETTREFQIKLIHKDYTKPLFIDLLLNKGTVYELKTMKSIVDPNRIQTLNYLYATDTQHGKLMNFRPKSVEHEFVSTQLNHSKRRNIEVHDPAWAKTCYTEKLRHLVIDLLYDWGAFFDTDIYLDALCHFLGGKEKVLRKISIKSGDVTLGTQTIPLLTEDHAFCLTSVSKDIPAYKKHLARFLKHAQLEALHWVNLNRSSIGFTSLSNESFCP
ncbi:GxxExxY protein [Pontiella sp.]|uniref:GxxExxY protein n=1 Tax=Pontiella sp. TaxID=2837462 RepID=UPI003569A840